MHADLYNVLRANGLPVPAKVRLDKCMVLRLAVTISAPTGITGVTSVQAVATPVVSDVFESIGLISTRSSIPVSPLSGHAHV
jgi:hypothetical protein